VPPASLSSPVGVAIATRDRRERVLETAARIVALPERPPLVVADDGSRDGTVGALRERFDAARVAVLALDPGHGSAARNTAVDALPTPYAAFNDDDSWWEPGALQLAAELFDANPSLALIAADVLVGPDRRPDPTCVAMRQSALAHGATTPAPRAYPVLGFVACGAIVRRAAFLAVGGFDRRYGVGGEEALLALDLASAGWELWHVPAIVAHHWPPSSGRRPQRDARTLRNDLWTTWLRRPARRVPAATLRRLRHAGWRASTARGLLAALRGARWVTHERRVLPADVERRVRLLEATAPPRFSVSPRSR
jgi:GT2 family glycosyltransferase